MEPQALDPLLTQPVELAKPTEPAKINLNFDNPEIQEMKKAVNFLESQKNSTFHEQFNRGSSTTFHNGSVNSMAMTQDEQYIVTGASDFTVIVWTPQNKGIFARFSGHRGKINSVSICDNASLVASASDDKTVKVWNMRMRKEEPLNNANIHRWQVTSVALSPDGKFYVSSSMEKDIVVFNIQRKAQEHKFMYSGITQVLKISRDSRYFVSADFDSIKIHNVFAKRWEYELKGHKKGIKDLAYSPNSDFLASASEDHSIIIWNLASRLQEFQLNGHSNDVLSVGYSKDGQFIVSGSLDKSVRVWRVETRKQVYRFDFHKDAVTGVIFFNGNLNLISCSADSQIAFYDLSNRSYPRTIESHKNAVNSIFITKDEKTLISASGNIYTSRGGDIVFMGTDDWCELARIPLSLTCIALSPDELLLAAGLEEKIIILYDVASKTEKLKLDGYTSELNSLSFSPDCQYLAGASGYINYHRKGELIVWSIARSSIEWKVDTGHSGYICSVQFLPDSVHVAAAVFSNIAVWNVLNKALVFTLNNENVIIHALAVSPDGDTIVSGDRNQVVKFWSLKHRRLDFSYSNSRYAVSGLKFSPDSQYLVSVSFDGSICLWNFIEKRLEFKFESNTKSVYGIEFDRQMKRIFTGGEDNLISVWEHRNGRPCTSLFGQNLDTWQIKFSPDYEPLLMNKNDINETKDPKGAIAKGKLLLLDGDLDPLSLFEDWFYNFSSVFNFLNSVTYDQYDFIESESWKLLIGNLKYTPLHFAAFKGKTKKIMELIETSQIYFRADKLGRSPIYYSIMAKHQGITDALLEYLIDMAQSTAFQNFYPIFYAVRNDLSNIILNSSPALCSFLSNCIYTKEDVPFFGVPLRHVQFIGSINPSNVDFVSDEQTNQEPLKFQTSLFELPATIGSEKSKALLSSFLKCTNRDLYSMPMIRNFIRFRWDSIRFWIYSYTFLLWLNLVLLTILIDQNSSKSLGSTKGIISLCAFIVVNAFLFVWEIFQLINSGLDYFRDAWNIIDLFRVIFTITWVILQKFDNGSEIFNLLQWFVVVFNLSRGVTGFRAFDTTRYYVGLIITSIKNISSFLFIFIFTVLSFGLLNISSQNISVDFYSLWGVSFSVGMGDFASMDHTSLNLIYFTYMIAIFFNVILMLNMIISILGDSFDEFQLFSVYYDNQEMTQTVLEIEEIFSTFKQIETKQYLHICINAYQTGATEWQGKVLEVQIFMKRKFDSLFEQATKNSDEMNEKMNQVMKCLEEVKANNGGITGNMDNIQSKLEQDNKALQAKVDTLENCIRDMTAKLEAVISKVQPSE